MAVPSGFTVTTGAVGPKSIEIRALPETIGVTPYRYVTPGDQTLLVEAGSRRILEVIR